jgi:hypothetical protein
MTRAPAVRVALPFLVCAALAGCGTKFGTETGDRPHGATGLSDAEQIRAADVSILYIGNSHTHFNELTGIVTAMIRHRRPGQTVLTGGVMSAFLETAAADPQCRAEIDTRPWKHVVLQGQKISQSGRFEYSRAEGIELAKAARDRGATVHFYAEWGLQGKPGDGPRMEAVYQDMAKRSGATVAPVGRAWEIALAEKPDLPLYSEDGNHQTNTGAFLTAAVLFAAITGDDPLTLADFDSRVVADAATRRLLLAAASRAVRTP